MKFSVRAWILLLNSVVVNAVIVTNAPAHTLKKCIQDGMGNIQCEEFLQDTTEKVSYWPPGPYVLPMTRYGCPESSLQGWREGFIRLAWKDPYQIQIVSNFSTIELFDNNFTAHWLPKNYRLFLPATLNSITLYFCYKHRSNEIVDKGSWPDGNYSIYKTEEDCPPDFENHSTNITVPDLSWWVSDGYLPDFSIISNNTEGILQLKLCSRWKSSNNTATDDNNFSDQTDPITHNGSLAPYRNWTHYFLIKNENTPCPIFASTVMFEESVYIENGQFQNMSSEMMKMMDTLCFYEQTTDEDWLYERRRKNAYSVTINSLTEGLTESSPDYEKYPYLTKYSGYFRYFEYKYIHRWTIVDLGRTIPVSAIEITTEQDLLLVTHTGLHQPLGPCINHEITCFISSGKWSFLQSEAWSCLYTEYCRVIRTSLCLVFKRIMEGRYVILMHQEIGSKFFGDYKQHFFYTVKVFTEVVSYDPNANCNADLGMQTRSILDNQISASSWLPEFTPSFSRPYTSGWCPQLHDPQPYLKVIFSKTQTIEGINVYTSQEVILIEDMETFVSIGSPFITLKYSEEVNGNTKVKILRIDSSKLITEAYTFWFMKAIQAKMIMMYLEKEQTSDLTCLRFEILGCKQNASYDKFYIGERQVPPFESVGFVSEVYTYNTVLASIAFLDTYQDSQLYKWIIRYPEFHFIKLIFTHLSLKERDISPGFIACNDSIIISNDLVDITRGKTRVIDATFRRRRTLSVETRETVIVVSFLTCPVPFRRRFGSGFKAIATYQEIPACFSVSGRLDWNEGSYEICRHSPMFITSLAYLGFEFYNTTEQWNIIIPSKRISLQFVEFQVPCKTEENVYFIIKDKGTERSFCNINRPPDIFDSSSDEITINFNSGTISQNYPGEVPILIGVRILYTSKIESGKHMIYYSDKYHKEVSHALHTDADRSYYTYGRLVLSTDVVEGKSFSEISELSRQDCFASYEVFYAYWWLLDLQDFYVLDYIVLFGAITDKGEIDSGNCQITLSTGMTIYDLQPTGYICGWFESGCERVINQKGIKTRYVRLHVDCGNNFLALCDLQVFGKLASVLPETATTVPILTSVDVDGEWGEWSPWSDVCFCDEKQYRYRLCHDPAPGFLGKYCTGDNISYRTCRIESASCKVYQENHVLPKEQNYCIRISTGNNTLSSWSGWSKWSSCSSKCGLGVQSRQRECFSNEIQGIKQQCVGESSETKSCIGNGTCLVCSDTFVKCYSIITKYTHWKQAQLECLRRNMTLVSILSLSEQRFVKYLLRQRRRADRLPTNYFDADFYVHIGLQTRLDSKYSTPIWDNGRYALYFTAWKINNTFSKRCTRMSFKYYEDDKTWESEDCEEQLSEYTMCEYHRRFDIVPVVKGLQIWTVDDKQIIQEQILPTEYNGQQNVTISGKVCINGSYCRANNDWPYLHCYIADGMIEECSVSLPPVENTTLVHYKYLGKLNQTFSGKSCQNWTSIIPHYHGFHGNMFKGEGILDAANYCRDLDDNGFLWCLTKDPDTRWELCLLKELYAERQCVKQHEYSGQKNTTFSGKTCKRWDRQKEIIKNPIWSTVNLTHAENYCRNLFNFGFIWCYVDSPYQTEEWEPCIPEDSETRQYESTRNIAIQSSDMFTCGDEGKIQTNLRCNGIFDCDDKTDETECLDIYNVHVMMRGQRRNRSIERLKFEEGSFFRCGTGEWISVIAKCDTVIDCLDASDEINCDSLTIGSNGCMTEQFQCDDGDCIHISLVCNFIEDCLDGSDEYCDLEACSPLTEYTCRNGQCIPSNQRCDAVKQCPDGSDEIECDTCQSGVFHCDIALCIPMRLLCDKFTHCQDNTDEQNCEPGGFTSCQDVWNSGFRKTGNYRIGPIQAFCSFENVYKDGEIITVLNFDIQFETDFLHYFLDYLPLHNLFLTDGIFYNMPSTITESKADFLIFNQANTNCTQQVMTRCVPSFEVFNKYEKEREYECYCGLLSYDLLRTQDHPTSIVTCPVISYMNLTLSSTTPLLNSSDIAYVFYKEKRSLILYGNPASEKLIEARPAVCKHEFLPTDNDFLCNINGKHVPDFERCIYDIDVSGFPTGCSDGSHLINCESFQCPENMLKCPGSYCVPQVFLCDGIHQCPGGEDEDECGCKQTNDEVLIIYDAVSTEGPNFARFAGQFYNRTNIVRLLGYKASRPLRIFSIEDILLEVHDTELNLSPNIEEAFRCNYKSFAKELLNSIHFINDGLKGVIVIQNSEISRDVFLDIAESITDSIENFRLYRVSQSLNRGSLAKSNKNASNFTDIQVRRWKTLDGIGAKYFSELCKLSSMINCSNGYKCSSSKSCIPIEQVCDGRTQCLHGDDEVLCDFKCPAECKCSGYSANCSATDFEPNMLYTVPKNTRHLDFSFNHKLYSVFQNTMINLTKLSVLNVLGCSIEIMSKNAFLKLRNLQTLDLSFNKISVLSNYVFLSLPHLKKLVLRGNNDLTVIEQYAFNGLSLIRDLQLANGKLFKILSRTFEGLKLKTLDLSNNEIREIENHAFQESFIESLDFDGNSIEHFNKEIFTGLIGLKILRSPAYKFCCIRPNYVPEQNCYPQKDEFSSCDDLMRHSGLQFMIWLIGIMALIGNVLSVFYRIKYDRDRLKLGYGIFVTNLALADFLMAVYLMIIAIADSAFRKKYIYVDDYWRHSIWCNIAGILSTTSSEASVLFLCFITLDRLLVIKYPFGGVRITTKVATACVSCAWIFSVFVAILPVAYVGYFNNEFYSKSGVCIALPLTRDRPPGWAYSLALFVCLNFITFVLVAVGQLSIFVEIRKSGGIATTAATSRKRDLKVARNLLLVVATDFLCWFPIGVMGLLALSGHPVSGEVYAWAAVFILPVNSALNPLLYTLSAIIGAKSFNPRAEEQSFIKITKDIGENAIKCLKAGHHISTKHYPKFQKLSTLNTVELDISWKGVIKIALKVACILDTLHCSSLGIQPLDDNCVFVEVLDRKLTGNIIIQGTPFVSFTPEDKEKNVHQFGMILRRLIAAKVRQE